MSVQHLPTLADLQATRRAVARHGTPSRLQEKTQNTKAAEKAWDACKKAVDKRDAHKCRHCHVFTEPTIALTPTRREHHHLVRRSKFKALLTDPRNVIVLCARHHEAVTRNELFISQKAADQFCIEGKFFLSADQPLIFTRAR